MEFRTRKKQPSQSDQHHLTKKRKRDDNFVIGEKILCFEPDDRLEKVLYDAKIKGINEIRDKRGKTINEFLVHFQGWSNSWDRKVSGDFILKDTVENRNLQKELAEKSQLQLGAYLYRKERKKRKKMNEMKLLFGASTDGNNSQADDNLDMEYYSSNGSSLEEGSLDDRVFLHIGDVLKKHIESDFEQVQQMIKPVLPSQLPVVTILEHFVKSYAMKVLTSIPNQEKKPKRRHSSIFLKKEKSETNKVDFEAISQKIDLCKEVADGLRIYFNFILQDFLLYPEEKDEIPLTFSHEEIEEAKRKETVLTINDFYRNTQSRMSQVEKNSTNENNTESPSHPQSRRMSRLRSQSSRTNEDSDNKTENASAQSSSSGDEESYESEKRGILSKNWFPLNAAGLGTEATKILEEVFAWRMLPENYEIEYSMIFGINYLCRLVVKLPEFLSATPMNEEKLTLLLRYLDDFVMFLEENGEMFGPHNYIEASKN